MRGILLNWKMATIMSLTWDDTPGAEYEYFNKTDQDFAATHIERVIDIFTCMQWATIQKFRAIKRESAKYNRK